MAAKKHADGGNEYERAAAKARKRWAESRKKKDSYGGLKFGEIPDGQYPARLVKARCGITKNGDGDIYYSLDFVLRDGDHDGTQVDVYHDLSTDQKADSAARTLKRLGFEIDDLDPVDIPEIIADLNGDPPDVILGVKNADRNKDGDLLDEPRAYVNVIKLDANAAPKSKAKTKPAAKPKAKPKAAK